MKTSMFFLASVAWTGNKALIIAAVVAAVAAAVVVWTFIHASRKRKKARERLEAEKAEKRRREEAEAAAAAERAEALAKMEAAAKAAAEAERLRAVITAAVTAHIEAEAAEKKKAPPRFRVVSFARAGGAHPWNR